MRAVIHVTLKKSVLDPQGAAIQRACKSLGHDSVSDVRQGKLFEVTLDAKTEEDARKLLDELCEKILSNPVIEEFHIERIEN